MATEYRALEEWQRPDSYIGATWRGWAPVVGQSRDSGPLERSNYAATFEALDCEPFNEREPEDIPAHVDAVDTRAGHWAVGWVETIYVRLGSPAADTADEILCALSDYPVLDEEDFSAREHEEECETVANCYVGDIWDAAIGSLDVSDDIREVLDYDVSYDSDRVMGLYWEFNGSDFGGWHSDGFSLDATECGEAIGWQIMRAAEWSTDAPAEPICSVMVWTDQHMETLGQLFLFPDNR